MDSRYARDFALVARGPAAEVIRPTHEPIGCARHELMIENH
jgi:hypothetical protein